MADVWLEIVAWDQERGVEEDANDVVNVCAPGNQLWVAFIKFVVHLVNVVT